MSASSLFCNIIILFLIIYLVFFSSSKELNYWFVCLCYIEQIQVEGQVSLIEYLRPTDKRQSRSRLSGETKTMIHSLVLYFVSSMNFFCYNCSINFVFSKKKQSKQH